MSTNTCIVWLKISCGATLALGLMSALASAEASAGLWLWLFDLLEWPVDGNPGSFQGESYALNAVVGGVLVGWAALMYLVVSGPLAKGDGELVTPLLVGLVSWFVVDSTGSLAADLPGNVVLNVGSLALFVPPLLVLRRNLVTTPPGRAGGADPLPASGSNS